MFPPFLQLVNEVDGADVWVLFLHLHDGFDDAVDDGIADPSGLLVSLPHFVVQDLTRRMSSRVMCVKSEILLLPSSTLLNSVERTLKKKKVAYEKQTEAQGAVTLAVVIGNYWAHARDARKGGEVDSTTK